MTDDAAIDRLFAAQKAGVEARRIEFGLKARLAALARLRAVLKRREDEIIAALDADFGKPATETRLTEIFPVLQEIAHATRHLRRWTRDRHERTPLALFGTRGWVRTEAKGVCLIIAPWNYPLNLALGPLVSALAAGNAAIVKPSEQTPATSALVASIVAEAFSPDLVTVVEGDAHIAETLLALPFDHIFFTGSPEIGKIVMQAAARSLASVTLELGGKSPVIVTRDANLPKAARHVVWGKFTNAGQTCVAPDHVFVAQEVAEAFVEEARAALTRAYGAADAPSPDYAQIVNDRHFERLHGLLAQARDQGARVLQGGGTDGSARHIAPTLIADTTPEMDMSREEIFGPVLPIIAFDTLETAIARINAGPKPLALYIFTTSRDTLDRIVDRTSSGGVGINITMAQYLNMRLPFGGVGHSGLGAAHGHYGFLEFSHRRAIVENRGAFLHLFFPPYTPRLRRAVSWVMRLLG